MSCLETCLEQLFCRESVTTCLRLKEILSRHNLRTFFRTLKARKTYYCSLYECYLLKRTTIIGFFLKIFENFKAALRNLVRSPFLLTLQPVDCKPTALVKMNFLQMFRRAFFQKCSTEL